MKRIAQTTDGILAALTHVEADWRDPHAIKVQEVVASLSFPHEVPIVEQLAGHSRPIVETIAQLVLGVSRDEFKALLKASTLAAPVASGGVESKSNRTKSQDVRQMLAALKVEPALIAFIQTPVTWRSVLLERLRGGRGSAIKGQQRGRALEDYVEKAVSEVFGAGSFAIRRRFTGEGGLQTEKADFAIPNSSDPQLLIEVKAYGATGSKQTDVLGDVQRIVDAKRHDTQFVLFTDGLSWHERRSDLRKLVELQNDGRISRIFCRSMRDEFLSYLNQFRASSGI